MGTDCGRRCPRWDVRTARGLHDTTEDAQQQSLLINLTDISNILYPPPIINNISSPLYLLPHPHTSPSPPTAPPRPTQRNNLGQNSQHVSIPNPHGLIHVTQPRHSLSFGLQDLRPNGKKAETPHVREALSGSHRQMLTVRCGCWVSRMGWKGCWRWDVGAWMCVGCCGCGFGVWVSW